MPQRPGTLGGHGVFLYTPSTYIRYFVVAIHLSMLAACTGNMSGEATSFFSTKDTPASGSGSVNFPYPAAALRRLTQFEYQNSVLSLLGNTNIVFNVAIDPDPSTPGVFTTVVASKVSSTNQDITQYESSALDLASQRFSSTARGQAFVGCTPSGSPNDTCIANFITTLGRRAFRRPLTTVESARYVAGYEQMLDNTNNVWTAASEITAAFLESPHFLYRDEVGAATNQNNVRVLNGYDMAARLSYFLWRTTPDDALLQAAEDGDLDTTQGVLTQADRLWRDPQARPAIIGYYEEWMGLSYLDNLSKDPNIFPQASSTIGHAMRLEFDGVVQNLVFDAPQSVTALLNTRQTYLNSELANLYGVTGIQNTTVVPYTFSASSPHMGLLTMAGFLAIQSPATRTSPTHRGLFVRENLLCQTLPSPPANVPPLDANASTAPMTMRQILTTHRSDPSCNSCHTLMDPLGLSMEHFDGIGAYRATDQGLTLDTTGELDSQNFADVQGLAKAVAARPDFMPCVERKAYAYAFGADVPAATDPTIAAMSTTLASGSQDFHAVVMALIASDAFRRAGALP